MKALSLGSMHFCSGTGTMQSRLGQAEQLTAVAALPVLCYDKNFASSCSLTPGSQCHARIMTRQNSMINCSAQKDN